MAGPIRSPDTVQTMRMLLTNDDGIDSVGLHILARAMRPHGDVVIAAPDSEYSGASAAIGALNMIHPQLVRHDIEGIDESWSVSGPPALCVMLSRLGVFGEPFDLIVAGINPGANVGRSVYHSGTVGAAVTARIGGSHGVAVSQAVNNWGVEGQSWEAVVSNQIWDTAAQVASLAVGGLVSSPPDEPSVLNINVPNVAFEDLRGWRYTEVAEMPARTLSKATLTPVDADIETLDIKMSWGEKIELPAHTDTGAVEAGEVSLTWLGKVTAESVMGHDATTAAVVEGLGSPNH